MNNANSNGIVTKGDIRAAFRRLAKAYHPDLNHSPQNLTKQECESLMTELVDAYQILLDDDDDFAARFQVGHSNKVALACELYSLGELRMDRFHDVYALKMVFDSDDDNDNDDHDNDNNDEHNKENDDSCSDEDHSIGSSLVETSNCHQTIAVHAHPEDSVSDLKRQLEEEHGIEWGLKQQQKQQQRSSGSKDDSLERRKDRDGLSIGWELLILREDNNTNDDDDDNIKEDASTSASCQSEENSSNSSNSGANMDRNDCDSDKATKAITFQNKVLSYHLFLDDYGIKHRETIYAVVRKNDI